MGGEPTLQRAPLGDVDFSSAGEISQDVTLDQEVNDPDRLGQFDSGFFFDHE